MNSVQQRDFVRDSFYCVLYYFSSIRLTHCILAHAFLCSIFAHSIVASSYPLLGALLHYMRIFLLGTLLGGTFLTRKKVVRLLPFILYLTFLALLYIANTYYAEKKVREIADIRKEMKELRYEYITTKSELMFNTKQTEIAKNLSNTGIEEPTQPPHRIYLEK